MKRLFAILSAFILGLFGTSVAFASHSSSYTNLLAQIKTSETPSIPDLPEVSGDYAVPEQSNLRLRVVAHPKPNHRTPTPVVQALCTPDNESSATPSLAGWHIKQATWTYRVNYGTVPSSVGRTNAETAIDNAFATWDGQISSVAFSEGVQTGVSRPRFDGQNAVMWRRLSSSNTLAVAYMWYYPSTGELAEADLAYNSRVPWSYTRYDPVNFPSDPSCSNLSSYDVQDVGTHEVGHWTGLNDMYDAPFVDNTMYGYADSGELKKDTLTTGDKQAVTSLYSL